MKNLKTLAVLIVAMLSINFAFAWLDPPTDVEKAYFKDNLKSLSEKEFDGFGVALGTSDLQTSVYIYKRQTLTADEWSTVFKDAFATNPGSWTEVYDYVLARIAESDYFETFGYFNLNNDTYWLNSVSISDSSLTGELSNADGAVGSVSMSPAFWSFWTGSADVDGESYRIVVLKIKN